jgi:hypothetical protein
MEPALMPRSVVVALPSDGGPLAAARAITHVGVLVFDLDLWALIAVGLLALLGGQSNFVSSIAELLAGVSIIIGSLGFALAPFGSDRVVAATVFATGVVLGLV